MLLHIIVCDLEEDEEKENIAKSDAQELRQQELFEIQKRPEAWGLVLLKTRMFNSSVQVKIARDWLSFPEDLAIPFRDLLTQLAAHSIIVGRNNVILRKLFISVHNASSTPSHHSV
ncbi:hypothetical protein F5146DRAFT_1142672 [Armillaria mellea]|nr:hypothetical protein F5146DRAFT_1142672 [Armillaria mellea]